MRDESNRIIQGMERQRRAEKAQRDENLRAMQENAAYTERITKENQAIEMQNLKNESQQKIANIQGAQEQAKIDASAAESIIGSLVDFSTSLQKTAAERTKQMIADQTAEGAAVELGAIDTEAIEQRLEAMDLQAAGSVKLNALSIENAVASNEDPLETKKALLGNPGYQGIKGRVVDNRVAYRAFTSLLTARIQDTEKVYTAPNGQTYTGIEARSNQYFMQDLKRQTKVDTFKIVGGSDPLHYADASEKIEKYGEVQVDNARAEEIKRTDAALEQTYADIESDGTTIAFALAFDGRRKAFGAAKAHDGVENLYANNSIPLEAIDALDINGDGKKYGETWPNRRAAGIKKRQANYVKQVNAEDALKKAEDNAWVNANIDSIQQAYDDNPEQAAMLVKQRYHGKGMTVPPVIAAIEREAIKKNKDIVENLVAQKTKFGNLDLTFVNSIQDATLQKTARAAFEQQELNKYGDEALGIKKGFKATARALTKINPNEEQGSAQTFLVQARLESEYLKQLKLTNDPLKALENVNQMVDKGNAGDKSSPFYIDPSLGDNNRPVFPNIETSDREVAEMNTYIDKQILSSGAAVAGKPFALANSKQMDATYTSATAGTVQYPPGILKFAEQFGFKPSEVYNAQRQANNATTGANKPLLTPSPVTDLIDGAPPMLRKLFMSDVDAQVRRGGAMLTGQLPMRTSMSGGMRGLAGLVSSGEGSPTSMFPGENYPEMTNMTIREVVELQKEKLGDGRASAAVGSYQFLYPEIAAQRAGLSLDEKFTPENQLKMFAGTLLNKPGRENVSAFLQGTGDDIEAAIDELSQEFASIEYRNGRSYYDDGVNKASISRDQVRAALLSAREELTTQ